MIPPSANTPVDDDATGRKNMQQLIQLRWIAVLGQVGTILVVFFVFRIELPLLYMFAVLAGLVAFIELLNDVPDEDFRNLILEARLLDTSGDIE